MTKENRGRGSLGYIPTPAEVREYRGTMTQTEASALIYTTNRIWRKYEAGESRMHPASWELLRYKNKSNIVEILKMAEEVAMWHIQDNDECGKIARKLLELIKEKNLTDQKV